MHNTFQTASDAFHDLYWRIVRDGVDFAGTKALFNVGFEIQEPRANAILDSKVKRNWSYDYAQAEWKWYLSGDRNIAKLEELESSIISLIPEETLIEEILIVFDGYKSFNKKIIFPKKFFKKLKYIYCRCNS